MNQFYIGINNYHFIKNTLDLYKNYLKLFIFLKIIYNYL